MSILQNQLLFYLVGCIESDGNFFVSLEKERQSRFGFKPKLRLSVDFKSNTNRILLKEFKRNFGGEVYQQSQRDLYRVKDIINLNRTITEASTGKTFNIPEFCSENLIGAKRTDGFLFLQALNYLKINQPKKGPGGGHSIDTFAFLVSVMFKINTKGELRGFQKSDWIRHFSAFDPNFSQKVVNFEKELDDKLTVFNNQKIVEQQSLNPYYVTGLTQGDGSLSLSFDSQSVSIKPRFTITLLRTPENYRLTEKLVSFFGVGYFTANIKERETLVFSSSSFDDILVIVEHFKKYPLMIGTTRAAQFDVMFKVIEMIQCKEHLTSDGITKIIDMTYSLYYEGERRELTKEKLIELFQKKYLKS